MQKFKRKVRMKTHRCLIFLALGFWLSAYAYADTANTISGREVKGVVVEDYGDRVVFSTVDGEVTVMKSNIKGIYYDSEEENLIKLAEQSKDKKDFVRAFIYYDQAIKINPDSKKALEGIVFLQGYLFRKEQALKEEDVKKREAIENYGIDIKEEPGEAEKANEAAEKLRKTVGLTIKADGTIPVIESVKMKSPAQEAGIKNKDKLIAVWAKLTGYLLLEEVTGMLLDKPSLELKCTIERDVEVSLASGNNIGASFVMEFDGLTISDVNDGSPAFDAGLKKGDLIVTIDGQSIRYMTLKKAVNIIRHSRGKYVKLTVRREVLIWRKD